MIYIILCLIEWFLQYLYQLFKVDLETLRYLLFWLMLFVNPESDAFSENPSDPWTQAG